MIEQRAIILSIEQDQQSNKSTATLEIERQTACGLCGQTRGCGNRIWGNLLGHSDASFKANNTIGALVGQTVIVAIDEQVLLKSALLLYGLPLICLFVFALLANAMWGTELASMLGGLAGLLVGWLWIKGYLVHRPFILSQQPEIIGIACHKQST
jgi:sigma-E factor negative regulatory protein RseC